jgi:hypothetical protein
MYIRISCEILYSQGNEEYCPLGWDDCVVWKKFTDVSDENVSSIFRVEE